MPGRVEDRLKELNVVLPVASSPAANYVPYRSSCGQLYISGQLPKNNEDKLITGQVGEGKKTVKDGEEAAYFCTLNLISQLKAGAGGDLDRIKKIVKITVFVNSTPDFTEQHLVANGASNFLVSVFGEEVGRHARCAVGMAQLPLGALVEVEAIAEVSE